jgi:transcriptional regulator with XRE-family HTH domain
MPTRKRPKPEFGRGSGARDPIDLRLGAKVRELRIALGLSQAEVATQVGLTFQQIQKYETATNRISASTLVKICAGLKISPGNLLDEIAGPPAAGTDVDLLPLNAARAARALATIRSDDVREVMFSLAKAISAAGL